MYGVIAMTVFVDLITAAGIGFFVANIRSIRRLADLQSEGVQVTDSQADLDQLPCSELQPEERALIGRREAGLKVLCLSGPMVFGAAGALNRQQTRLADARSLVIDLTEVPHLGVTTSLALERRIRETTALDCPVYLAGLQGQPWRRLQRLRIEAVVPPERWIDDRSGALRQAAGDRMVQPPIGGPATGGTQGAH